MVLRTGFYTLVLPLKLGLLILTAFLAVLFFSNTTLGESFPKEQSIWACLCQLRWPFRTMSLASSERPNRA